MMNTRKETVLTGREKPKNSFSLPKLLSVSPSPHMRCLDTTRSVMLDVIIALLPATVWGIYTFGIRAAVTVAVSIAVAVISELLYEVIMRKTVTVADLSAVVTGLILGLSMPPAVPAWVPAAGSAFAIVIVKQLFGGLGKNIVNPAITARLFLMLCWPSQMTMYVDVKTDLVSAATPLTVMKTGVSPSETVFNCVIGNIGGAIGEVSAIALFAGFIYLLVRRVVSWQIPVGFIGTVMLWSALFPNTGDNVNCMLYNVFCGGLLLCALICADDYSTTPVTAAGRLIFGVGCGLVTMFIRYFGAYADGCAFAIVIMNLLVPFFEKWTAPVVFGKKHSARVAENGTGGETR